ncbi:MAG: DUF4861 family protein [Paludibacteraceae bacterium]|nr:DUF4861 family protein [Paludibacteraceae bacterium]
MKQRFIIFLQLSILLTTACNVPKSGSVAYKTTKNPKVYAEMFLKSKTPKEGYIYHEAEGKSFYMRPVSQQTFYPGEDSYQSMHHHGVAFESELMAYRIYFDKKQTIDVYAKKTPRLELASCTWYPTDKQLRQGFGDDILRVSGWIGVGSCKPFNGEKMTHFDDVLARTQRIVENGPQRTVCEVEDSLWLAPDGWRYNITTRYTLYAGHRDVMAEVFLSQPTGNTMQQTDTAAFGKKTVNSADSLPQLCTGVQLIGKDCKRGFFTYSKKNKMVSTWGTAFPVNDTVKYGKETVGLAVCVPVPFAGKTKNDKHNQLILLRLQSLADYTNWDTEGVPCPAIHEYTQQRQHNIFYAKYFFTVVAQKEQNPPCKDPDEFSLFLKRWAQEL